MTTQLRVLVPDATTNYVLNPAMRFDTTGWNSLSSTISRSFDYARFNIASLKVVTSGLLNREGAYYRVNAMQGISDTLTASVYLRGSGRVHLRLIDNPTGREWISKVVSLTSSRWQRVEVTGMCTGSNDVRVYVETDDKIQAVTFYVDGMQMERKAYATTYCDGDQLGCKWAGVYHGSQSSRSAYTREGGRWVTLAGPCDGNENIYVTMVGGAGMAPLNPSRQSYALNPGSYYQSVMVSPRTLTFTFHVKNKSKVMGAPDLSPLHKLHQQLIDIFKPDVTSGQQHMLLEFIPGVGSAPQYIWATYEGGLEGSWDIRNQWVGAIPIRFVADDPLFHEDNQEVASLKFKRRLLQSNAGATNIGVMRRKEGVWDLMNLAYADPNIGVLKATEDKFGNVYFVGQFDSPGHVHDVCKWDGSALIAMGTGVSAVSTIQCVEVDSQGNVYVGGSFSSIGGVAANNIAMWNGSNWVPLGSGANSGVQSMLIAENGSLYISGVFTQVGGMAVNRFARWDGSSWHALAGTISAGISRAAKMIMLDDNRTIFLCGFGNPSTEWMYPGIGLIDTLTNTVKPIVLSGGYHNAYSDAAKDKNGSLWLVGTTSPGYTGLGTDTPHRCDRFGISFFSEPSGSSSDGSSETISILPNGLIVVYQHYAIWRISGEITLSSITENPCYIPGVLYLDRGVKIPPDFTFGMERSIALRVSSGFVSKDGTLYAFTTSSGLGADVSDVTDVLVDCSAPVWPVLEISGPGRLRWLENMSTGCILAFNILLSVDEVITIDFQNAKMTSSTRGDVQWGMMSNRSLREFFLIPGNNRLVTFMFGETAESSMRLKWVPRNWSADAVMIEAGV